jgi:hypothetical protein
LYAIGYLFSFVHYITYPLTLVLVLFLNGVAESASDRFETHGIFGKGARIDFNSPIIQRGASLFWFWIVSLVLCLPILWEYVLSVSLQSLRSDTFAWKVWIFLFSSIYFALHMKAAQFRDAFPGWLGSMGISYIFWTIVVVSVMTFLEVSAGRIDYFLSLAIWALLAAIPTYLWITWVICIGQPIRRNFATLELRNAWMRAVNGLPGTVAFLAIVSLHFSGFQLHECVSASDLENTGWQFVAIKCALADPYWSWIPLASILGTLLLAPLFFRWGRKISCLPIRL